MKESDMHAVRKFCLEDGGSLKLLGDVDEKDLIILENYGKQLMIYKNYAEAINIFRLLMTIDQWNGDYFYSSGLCYREVGELEDAIRCFAHSAIINSDDPRSAFYSAEILLQMDKKELAIEAYKSVLAICKTYKKWEMYEKNAIESLLKLEGEEEDYANIAETGHS